MAMRVYVVEVVSSDKHRISQEGYETIEDARRFIRSRSDNPQEVTRWCFRSANCEYLIHDVVIR